MRITEQRLRKIIREEIKSKLSSKKKVLEGGVHSLVKNEINKNIEEGIFDSLFGGKKKKQQAQQPQAQQQQKQGRSLSTQDVGQVLGTIDQGVKKLAKNAEEEDMPDVAAQIQDAGDEFLDDIKDSGMMATQDYSKKGMFAQKKKFKGAPQKKGNNSGDEDVVTSVK